MKISLSDMSQLGRVVAKLASLAEVLLPGATGAEKKEYVVNWLNDHIDVPFLSEDQEGKIISALVDAIAALLD